MCQWMVLVAQAITATAATIAFIALVRGPESGPVPGL